MLGDLLPLFALVGAAVAIWVIRERRRRRFEVDPPQPDIAIAQAWEMCRRGPADHPDRALLATAAELEPPLLAALQDVAARALAADHPRMALREAILEFATLALHLETIAAHGETERALLLKGYEPGMDALLRATLRAYAAEWFVLRWYAHMKYDDAVADDWFQHYLHVARPYIREKVRLAGEFLLEVDPSAGRFAEIYDRLLDDLRRQLLAAPPKKRFPPPDIMA